MARTKGAKDKKPRKKKGSSINASILRVNLNADKTYYKSVSTRVTSR